MQTEERLLGLNLSACDQRQESNGGNNAKSGDGKGRLHAGERCFHVIGGRIGKAQRMRLVLENVNVSLSRGDACVRKWRFVPCCPN